LRIARHAAVPGAQANATVHGVHGYTGAAAIQPAREPRAGALRRIKEG
jgi:hypothetical protein